MTPGAWAVDWGKAKDAFKEATGKSKPDIQVFGVITKHKTEIGSKLKLVDEAYKGYATAIARFADGKLKEQDVEKWLNQLGLTVNSFTKSKDSYVAEITKTISKMVDANGKTLYTRAMTTMKKTLDALSADIDTQQKVKFHHFRLEIKTKENPAITTQEKIAISTDPIIMQGIISTSKKGQVFTSQVKTLLAKHQNGNLAPVIKYFDDHVATACRDVTQGVLNAQRRLGVDAASIKAHQDLLVHRNDGNYQLPATATAVQIAKEIKDLSAAFKETEKWAVNNK